MSRLARPVKWMLGAAVAALVATSLTACVPDLPTADCSFGSAKAPDSTPAEVAFVVAPTTTFADFDKVTAAATPLLTSAVPANNTHYTVTLADGSPSVVVERWASFASDLDVDKDRARQNVSGMVNKVVGCATGQYSDSITTTPEVDLLGAMAQAADSLTGTDTPKQMVVMSNGLMTAGQYSFAEHGIPAAGEAQSIVDQLKSQGALPDLTGIVVNFVGLGHTSGDQPQLNTQSIDALEIFWRTLVQAAGGTVGTVTRTVTDGTPASGSITASPVAGLAKACVSTQLTEADGFTFEPDTATFTDLAKAQAGAASIAAQIASAGCSTPITLVGYVASGVSQSQYVVGNAADAALSLARADAFKTLLQQAGVTTTINTVGGGKGPVTDWNSDGSFNETLGAQNRLVTVTQ